MSKREDVHTLHNSVEDSSWTTISITDEIETPHSDEESLDETLPLDALDALDTQQDEIQKASVQVPSHSTESDILALPLQSPMNPPSSMKDFLPVFCSSSAQLHSAKSYDGSKSISFCPTFCSSKIENPYTQNVASALCGSKNVYPPSDQKVEFLKHSAPVMCEILKLKPRLGLCSTMRADSEEFKPQRCSTARSESELKVQQYISALPESANLFVPLRCSSELSKSSAKLHDTMALGDFKPYHCSTMLQHNNSVAFMPLRCSTGLNDSAAFNPPLSSTAQQHMYDSNIPEFGDLRMHSETHISRM